MKKEDIEQLDKIGLHALLKSAEGMTVDEFILRYSKIENFPVALAADQIRYHDKIKKKYPLFAEQDLLVTGRAFEQSSSQATALYKSSRMSGDSIVDITGGLGVDSIFLSKNFNSSYYCEADTFLYELSQYNFKKLNLKISSQNDDAIQYLKQFDNDTFDWLYVDPSRRVEGKRVTALSMCEPDVTSHIEILLKKSKNVCIKAAPAYDISMAIKEIRGLYEIAVVSYLGECREVLLFCSRENVNNVILRSVIVQDDGSIRNEFVSFVAESNSRLDPVSLKEYFYVVDPVLFKTGQFQIVAEKYNLSFVNNSVGYLSGDKRISNFPGKVYIIKSEIPWGRKSLLKYLKINNIKQALIARRDFPLDPKGLRKMLGLSDGGLDYLFFTRNYEGKKVCIHCTKC